MLDLLHGVRQVKAAGYEATFAARVGEVRREELAALAVRKYTDAACVYCWAATSLLFSLATFGLFAALGRTLTAQARRECSERVLLAWQALTPPPLPPPLAHLRLCSPRSRSSMCC